VYKRYIVSCHANKKAQQLHGYTLFIVLSCFYSIAVHASACTWTYHADLCAKSHRALGLTSQLLHTGKSGPQLVTDCG
jgi:hypothetical protein